MKCKYCSGSMTIEDEFCPYCGAVNDQARRHIEDMKRFNRDYEYTKAEVMHNASVQSTRHSFIIALIILIVLNVFIFFCQINVWEINYFLEEREIKSHADSYAAKLASYEENAEYGLLHSFYSRNGLYSADSLREYNSVSDMAYSYTKLQEAIFYLSNPDVKSYYTQGDLLGKISDAVEDFYDTYKNKDSSSDFYKDQFSELHLKSMEDMESRMLALLKANLGLKDSDLSKLSEMESSDIMILIARRLELYEEE